MSNDIINVITRLFWAVDHHDWDTLPKVLDKEVLLNYGEPATLTPTDIVSMWRPLFTALDTHQHLVGNHLVTASGNAATVTASFIATHQYAGETWTLGGDYEFRLLDDAGWRITAMTMTPVWQTGPADLIQRATGN